MPLRASPLQLVVVGATLALWLGFMFGSTSALVHQRNKALNKVLQARPFSFTAASNIENEGPTAKIGDTGGFADSTPLISVVLPNGDEVKLSSDVIGLFEKAALNSRHSIKSLAEYGPGSLTTVPQLRGVSLQTVSNLLRPSSMFAVPIDKHAFSAADLPSNQEPKKQSTVQDETSHSISVSAARKLSQYDRGLPGGANARARSYAAAARNAGNSEKVPFWKWLGAEPGRAPSGTFQTYAPSASSTRSRLGKRKAGKVAFNAPVPDPTTQTRTPSVTTPAPGVWGSVPVVLGLTAKNSQSAGGNRVVTSVLTSNLYEVVPVVYKGNTNQLILPINDEFVSGAIRQSKTPWQEDQLNAMMEYIVPGTGVLDVGANLGSYTVYFAQKAAQVTSFEPQPLMFQLLCANVLMNDLGNVKLVNSAVSFKIGVTHMSIKLPDGTSKGTKYDDAFKNKAPINYGGRSLGKGGETVAMTYLDAMEFTNISFIKIDVQGAEKLVFYGARETIRKHLPVINFEQPTLMNPFTITQEMIEDMAIPPELLDFEVTTYLRSLGYMQAKVVADDSYWVPPGYKSSNR